MNRMQNSSPPLEFMLIYLRARMDRVRNEDMSRGASAVEWVVISAIVVGIVAVVGFVIKQALQGKADSVGNCINSTTGDAKSC